MWKNKKVTVAVSGGIAAYKVCSLVSQLVQKGAKVKVAMTGAATSFVSPNTFAALSGNKVYTDLFDCPEDIPHIRLAQDCDLIVVAPATANLAAKLAHGIGDDLVSALLLAAQVPIVVVPAMNSGMWSNPVVQQNFSLLAERGINIVPPGEGFLACGTQGTGRFPDQELIMDYLEKALTAQTLSDRKILVSAGPTREYLDPVRFLSNPSTGLMGLELARAAWLRGAKVRLISGPISQKIPSHLDPVSVVSALEMHAQVLTDFPEFDTLFMSAAVADYRPAREEKAKIKKGSVGLAELVLTKNPDILLDVKKIRRADQVVIGFAAETSADILELARAKLNEKELDFIVANTVNKTEAGFGSSVQDRVIILGKHGDKEEYTSIGKRALAMRLCDLVSQYKVG